MRARPRTPGTVLVIAAFFVAMGPATARAGVPANGVVYTVAGDEAQRLDAFIPDDSEIHPGVVLIHGGGWTRGSRATLASLGRWLAARGVAAFAIDYRLAPEHRYPAAVEDAQAAVRWIRAHAAEYRVDPSRLGAFGMSAGGYIAAMLATLGEGPLDRAARVRVAVAWSAPLDLAGLPPAMRPLVEAFVGCSDCVMRLREASPAAHADETDAALFLANAASEAQPIAGAERLARILTSAGVPSMIVRVPGSRHAGEYGGMVLQAGGDSVLEATLRYMRIWFDQPRVGGGQRTAPAPAEPVAPGLALLAALALAVAGLVRLAERQPRRDWFDPAAMAMIDALEAAGVPAAQIETTIRLRAPRPGRFR